MMEWWHRTTEPQNHRTTRVDCVHAAGIKGTVWRRFLRESADSGPLASRERIVGVFAALKDLVVISGGMAKILLGKNISDTDQ